MQGCDLRAIREGLGLTQRELAEVLDMSRVMVGLMERGEKPIERRTALAALYLRDNPGVAATR